jgi:hypothetical protein
VEEHIKDFDDMKRRYPTAVMFTVAAPHDKVTSADLLPYFGRVNSAAFAGKAPETLLLLAFEGDDSKPLDKIVFFHRPEGWNVGALGVKSYPTADFGRLAALNPGA